MAELTPMEKLDLVLKTLASDRETKSDFTQVDYLYNSLPNNVWMDLQKIIDKLERDGYLEKREMIHFDAEKNEKYPFDAVLVTFEGLVFYEQGGYKAQLKRENRARRNSNILNVAIAIGGGMAALFYLLEILRVYVFPFFSCH